jgi:hypothetical protein
VLIAAAACQDVGLLGGCVDAIEEALAMALEHLRDALDFDNVDAMGQWHERW